MDVYGLTGGIGSGKSTVAALLEDYGIPVVSADELSRIVVSKGSEGLNDVVDLFGEEVLDDKGELDRRKMAAIVFQEPGKRKELESILHPRIRERFEQVLDAMEKAGHEVAIYEVPLLFEKNLQGEMKAVLLVTADEQVRIRRVKARDDVTETEVRARIAAQMDEGLKRKKADYIVENNGTMDDLRREVEFLLARFLRLSSHPELEENNDRVTEIPIKSGATAPPVPTRSGSTHPSVTSGDDVPGEDEAPKVKTLVPGGVAGGITAPAPGVPSVNPNAVRAESVPIPVAPTAPPTFGRPQAPPPEPPPSNPAAAKPAKPARPSEIETPLPVPHKRDPSMPVRSGETVIGPRPAPPPLPGDSAPPDEDTRRKSPTQPGRERKTIVATHVPNPPAPLAPTTPNVPPAPTPTPGARTERARPAPPRAVAPEPTAQVRRGSVPPEAPPPNAGAPPPIPTTPSSPPPAAAAPVGGTPPTTPLPPMDSQPPSPRPRTQTMRVNALTAEDLAEADGDSDDANEQDKTD